ncbi:MAG: HEPN domain-containing protein [Acidobacteriota bacterium]|jgi:HEPN domain-containing protein|nr:HEPN domain-containing protein [Acidobacteriota bacterium]
MINPKNLKAIATARLKDAEILYSGKRYDGAVYLCGYAIELNLKARICKTLKWTGFPSTNSEFQGLQSFKTHRLDLLLKLSGQENKIKTRFLADWSVVADWNSETRYSIIGTVSKTDASDMIESAKVIIKALR